MQPNIYTFAKTEYAQDAFIAWLCSCYAESSNTAKRQIAERFIKDLLGVSVSFTSVTAEPQKKNIDVLLTLDGGKYYVIIEDKTYSEIHDNQLCRYVESMKRDKKIEEDKIFVVYYKTGHISRTPNWIYFRDHKYFYNRDRKSEGDSVKELLVKFPHLAGLTICDLPEINSFFQSVSNLIQSSGSEILEDYADSIKTQYQEYTSSSINAKKGRRDEIWGKIFDDFIINTGSQKYPDLSFKLDYYSGNYWEIYITGPIVAGNGEQQYSEPILNVRSDIFEGKTQRIYFFFADKLTSTKSLIVNKMSASYILPVGKFMNPKLNSCCFQSNSISIADINTLLEAICEEFDRFVVKKSSGTFKL